ncbi:acyltransferase, partial [Lactobacillus paragasseri]|nr:acyltransferase [Lactobacillus paragasseri]
LRRLRRIAPAAMFVLFISIAVAGLVGGDPAVGLSTQFLGTVFFVNNWTQIAGSQSYFADSGVQLLAHYWSLSVEEQFYLLWPLIFVALL